MDEDWVPWRWEELPRGCCTLRGPQPQGSGSRATSLPPRQTQSPPSSKPISACGSEPSGRQLSRDGKTQGKPALQLHGPGAWSTPASSYESQTSAIWPRGLLCGSLTLQQPPGAWAKSLLSANYGSCRGYRGGRDQCGPALKLCDRPR